MGISLAIVCHFAANYYDFTRGDAALEYQVYLAIVNGNPMPFNSPSLLVSCLTTTWLPAMIQRLTHFDMDVLFRYYAIPLMVWSPFVVYLLAARFVTPFESFCVGLLYIAQPYFVVAPMVSRIVIANTLLLLSILIPLQRRIPLAWKVVLLTVILGAMVVTAYSVTFLAVGLYAGWLLVGFVYGWRRRRIWKSLVPVGLMLLIVVVASAFWLGFMTWLPWALVKNLVRDTLTGAAVQNGMTSVVLGQTFWTMNNVQRFDFLITWLVMGLITLGLVLRAKRFSIGQAAGVAAYALLVVGVLIPALDAHFGIQRVYFCVSGLLLIFLVYSIRWLAKLVKVSPCISLAATTVVYAFVGSGLLYYTMGYDRFLH